MIILGILIIFILGLSIIQVISENFSIPEKLSLSYLFGIGSETIFMFILDILKIPFTANNLATISLIIILLLNIKNILNWKSSLRKIKKVNLPGVDLKKTNLIWLFCLGLICFFLYGNTAKSLYWPTTAYDNVAGYDLMGKVMASEGKIKNSLFEINDAPINGSAQRIIYPPLAAGSFAYAYLYGLQTSKLMSSLFFCLFAMAFYGVLRNFTSQTNSIITTLFCLTAPEMFAFASLSTTNVPCAIYASLGIIYLYLYIEVKELKYLLVASLLLAFAVWTRSDAIVFCASGFVVLLFYAFKNKSWKDLILYSLMAFSLFLAWNLYIKFNINENQAAGFRLELFWDYAKVSRILFWLKTLFTNTILYGIAFYVFFAAILINIKKLHTDKTVFLVLVIFAWILYTGLFYQMSWPIDTMMSKSYRRGLFSFVPLLWFYIATNKFTINLFNKFETYLYGQE